jgi:replicative DNA helicase
VDVERAFLSKLINDECTVSAVSARITPDFFTDPQWKRIFGFLLDHFRTYGTDADLAVVTSNFPNLEWPPYPQPLAYFTNALRERRQKTIYLDGLNRAAQLVGFKDPDDLVKLGEILQSTVMQARVETAPAFDADFVSMGTDAAVVLDERILDPGFLRGISSGFKAIDYVTGGFQPEQLVTMIGLPKSMKSSTLLYMTMMAHKQAKSPLFIGFEMNNGEQRDRLSSLYANVGLTKIITGTVTYNEHMRIIDAWKRLRDMRKAIFSTDIENAMTVSGVQAKIMEYQPDIVFIDAAYLMMPESPKVEPGSAQALTEIARGLKMLAQAQHLPVVVTTQATQNRAGRSGKLNMYSAMYTQAWGQSSDVLLGVERLLEDQTDDQGEVIIRLKVLTSRSGPLAQAALVWDWSQGRVLEIDPSTVQGASSGS